LTDTEKRQIQEAWSHPDKEVAAARAKITSFLKNNGGGGKSCPVEPLASHGSGASNE
jgi:hypothetical protein